MEADTFQARDRRGAWAMGGLLAVTALCYLVRGMPWVNLDDLAFAGAGIELARSGQLANHAMDGWLADFGTDKFYIQMPFGIYSLAAWIRLFGVGTVQFIAFEWVWYLAGGYGLVRTLGRFALPMGGRLLLVLMYLTLVIQTGFRPEAEAFGLMFLGLGWLEARASGWWKTGALVLLGLSLLTYPVMVALAVPFAAAILWSQGTPEQRALATVWEIIRAWTLPGFVSVGLVILAFLAMIHFEPHAFFAVFNAHRRLLATHMPGGPVRMYFGLMTQYNEAFLRLPALGLLAVAGGMALRPRRLEAKERGLIGVCALATAACVVLYAIRAPQTTLWLEFCAGCALFSAPVFRRRRWTLLLGLVALYLWSQVFWVVNASLRRFPDAASLQRAREAASGSGKELVVDSSTARCVFDFHLPAGTRALSYLKPWRREDPMGMADKKPGAIWVVSGPFLAFDYYDAPAASRDHPSITLGRHRFQSLALRPDEPLVIP